MRPELPYLTSIRGICAAAVLAFHCGWFSAGQCGVLVFFVLSGYVLAWGHIHRPRTAGAFWVARLRRTAPVHLVTTSVVGVLVIAAGHGSVTQLLANLALLPAIGQGMPINPPTWSLAVEWLAYLLFPLLIGSLLRHPALTVAACAAIFVSTAHLTGAGWLRSIPWGLSLFGFGVALAASGWEPVACRWLTWLDARPLRWLGDVSYPLYLGQTIAFVVFCGGAMAATAPLWQHLSVIATSLILAALLHHCVEVPGRRAFNVQMATKPYPSAPASN